MVLKGLKGCSKSTLGLEKGACPSHSIVLFRVWIEGGRWKALPYGGQGEWVVGHGAILCGAIGGNLGQSAVVLHYALRVYSLMNLCQS